MASGIVPIHAHGRHGATACVRLASATSRPSMAVYSMPAGKVGGVSGGFRK